MIWLILMLALVLRLVNLDQSLWLDEAIGALAARDLSYEGILTSFAIRDNHPPFFYLALKFWISIVDYSEVSMRMLSVVLGVSTVWIVYKIAQNLIVTYRLPFTKYFSYLSALFLATAPLHIYYSQEVRMYAMAAFFAAVSVYFFLRESWLFFSLALVALLSTDYVPVFLLPVFFALGVIQKHNKAWWIRYLLSHIPLIIFGFLWFPTFLKQLEGGRWLVATLPAWATIAGGATLKEAALFWIKFILGRVSFDNNLVYATVVIAASLPILFAMILAWKKKTPALLWMWFFFPSFLAFLASFVAPIFIYFRFLFVLPALYLLVAWGTALSGSPRKLLVSMVLLVSLFGWGTYLINQKFWREDWRNAVSFIKSNATQSDVVLFAFSAPFAPYQWYSNGSQEAYGALASIRAKPDDGGRIVDLIKDKKGVYYFAYLQDLTDPDHLIEKTLIGKSFSPGPVREFRGLGQVTYWIKE